LGKAVLDSTALTAVESYVPGFGFGSPALLRCFLQKQWEWGPAREVSQGAVMAQLLERQVQDSSAKWTKARQMASQGEDQLVGEIFQQWVSNLPKTAKVENNLDRVYRN
jgi:hypothetical protein